MLVSYAILYEAKGFLYIAPHLRVDKAGLTLFAPSPFNGARTLASAPSHNELLVYLSLHPSAESYVPRYTQQQLNLSPTQSWGW